MVQSEQLMVFKDQAQKKTYLTIKTILGILDLLSQEGNK